MRRQAEIRKIQGSLLDLEPFRDKPEGLSGRLCVTLFPLSHGHDPGEIDRPVLLDEQSAGRLDCPDVPEFEDRGGNAQVDFVAGQGIPLPEGLGSSNSGAESVNVSFAMIGENPVLALSVSELPLPVHTTRFQVQPHPRIEVGLQGNKRKVRDLHPALHLAVPRFGFTARIHLTLFLNPRIKPEIHSCARIRGKTFKAEFEGAKSEGRTLRGNRGQPGRRLK